MQMHTLQPPAVLVAGFIEDFWNGRQFHKAGDYFHADYRDHSVPPGFPAGPAGTIQWIEKLGASFIHRTQIEEVITEAGTVVLRVRLHLKHTGPWRGIQPTGAEVSTTGFRVFRVEAGKITQHLALIDGESLEKQLKGLTKACVLPV
jgi:hypothetical protein